MKAYSIDLRERVLRAADQGMAHKEIARVLAVSLATLGRYLKQRRDMGQVRAKAIPGRPSKKMAALQAGLADQVQRFPDATLEQHAHYWEQQQGMQVSRWSVGRALKRMGLTRKKKTVGASERNEEARRRWREQMKGADANSLVVVDETGSNIGLTPLYAWAPKGQRALGRVPRNYGQNTTLLASLSLSGMGAAMILEGSTDTLAFERYVEEVLAPSLQPGQIVLMDNLSAHSSPKVRQAIEAKGCQVRFLPSYSPDFSPIEGAFSKIKAFLRRVGARTRQDLYQALGQALDQVTVQDARGWFTHCGYLPAKQEAS
jgi:transposase